MSKSVKINRLLKQLVNEVEEFNKTNNINVLDLYNKNVRNIEVSRVSLFSIIDRYIYMINDKDIRFSLNFYKKEAGLLLLCEKRYKELVMWVRRNFNNNIRIQILKSIIDKFICQLIINKFSSSNTPYRYLL